MPVIVGDARTTMQLAEQLCRGLAGCDGVVRIDMDGAPPRMAEPGDWVGAVPLITGGPHQGTATVLVASHILRIERADFEELLDEDGELARALMAGLLRSLTSLIPTAVEAA